MLFNEPKLLKSDIDIQSAAHKTRFSALQRAEIAEMSDWYSETSKRSSFSALQRAEIAEISRRSASSANSPQRFSALQRAEIAEIFERRLRVVPRLEFQCSSTSRNC